jgi:CubicO group peptidase (beta-lactamase class C family)
MRGLLIACIVLAACGTNPVPADTDTSPSAGALAADLPSSTPETQGYSSAKLATLKPYLESIHSPAGMVVVHGHVIYTWGDVTEKMQIHSIRKSFLSALCGLAVSRGELDLSATLAGLGIDDVPPALTAAEKQATLQELIESRSGVYHPANYETASEKTKRPPRGSHPPGTFWYYNNWDFNAAGAIFERQTQRKIFDAFAAQIATKVGMQDYSPADGSYEIDPSTPSQWPAYLFNMSTRDMARFGLLYLGQGAWSGNQIVPKDWILASTTSYSETGGTANTGYGYLWWIGENGAGLVNAAVVGAGAFAAEGSGGHYIVVLPAYDMVVVNRADDAYYRLDEANNNIGPNRLGQILVRIFAAKN